jgi:hypothetical protein
MENRLALIKERAMALGLVGDIAEDLDNEEISAICQIAGVSAGHSLRDELNWRNHYSDISRRAAAVEKEREEDKTGMLRTLAMIDNIRESENIVDTMYAVTGYYLPEYSRTKILSILNEWENELKQENYIRNSTEGNQEEYDERYFQEGHKICLEAE